jgi:hypothetical protein
MARKRRNYLLKLDKDNERKEREFELNFQQSLTIAERFKLMFYMSNLMKEMLIKNGHRKPFEIIKRDS